MAKRVKRKWIMLLLLFSAGNIGYSQVLIIPEIQNGGIILRQQIWSVVLNNVSGDPKKVLLAVSVTDRNTSQPLMEATSGIILLNSGVKRVMYNDLAPVSYSVSTIGFGMDSKLNQPLPVGEYVVCYKIMDLDNKNEVLATECVKVIAEPLSPPQLIQPENESVISDARPVLVWTPPAPVMMYNTLTYDIVVSPLYDKQSPQEALQRNIPVMTTMSANNSILYPSAYTDLQQGKSYVWQVAAKDGGRFGGKSEVFTFTVIPDSVAKIIDAAPYIKLAENNMQTTVLHQGVLRMEYFNTLPDTTVKVQAYILSDKAAGGRQQLSFNMVVKPGQNFLEYKINNRIRLNETSVYEVKLTNSLDEHWLMKFSPKYYF